MSPTTQETDIIYGALALWLSSSITTILFLARLSLRKYRRSSFTLGDACIMVAMVFNCLRIVGEYYANQYGTPLSTFFFLVLSCNPDYMPISTLGKDRTT